MSKEAFAKSYADQANISIEEFAELNFFVVPCSCASRCCDGWKMQHGAVLKKWKKKGIDYGEAFPVKNMDFTS